MGVTNVMSSKHQRLVTRRIASVVSALLGIFLVVSAAGSHVENLRAPHIEYTQNLSVFAAVSIVFVAIGMVLLFAAWRLWPIPE